MSSTPYKYVQTIVSREEADEIDNYVHMKGIKNKREWIREIILKEVREDGTKPLPLH